VRRLVEHNIAVYPAAWLPEAAECAVVVVNRGPVELAAAPNRYFADAELDPFFTEVARELGLAVAAPA
jgi:hypothetical protein